MIIMPGPRRADHRDPERESDLKNGSQPIEEVKDGSVVFENVSLLRQGPQRECLKNVEPHGEVR